MKYDFEIVEISGMRPVPVEEGKVPQSTFEKLETRSAFAMSEIKWKFRTPTQVYANWDYPNWLNKYRASLRVTRCQP